jgi:LysM repeat protein
MNGVEHIPPKWHIPPMMQLPMTPLVITDHIMVGWLTTMVNWMSNGESKIIAHFGISSKGRIVQFHPINRVGRHVSALIGVTSKIALREGQHPGTTGANGYSIGIEHEGLSLPYPGDPASLRPITWSKTNPWPDAMVEASIAVKRWCFANAPSLGTPSRDTIIGHYETDSSNRPDDPAAKSDRSVWPVDKMLAALGNVTPAPEEPISMSNAYVVKSGDSLGKIATDLKVPQSTLVTLNKSNYPTLATNPGHIEVGWVLRWAGTTPLPAVGGAAPDDHTIALTQIGVIERAAGIARESLG